MRSIPCVISGLATLFIASLTGCSKKSAQTEPASEPPVPITAATPLPATPVPAAPAPVLLPTPQPKRLASAGTFFLLVKKSVVTNDGVIGFKPGTQLKQQADGSFTAEGHKLDVRPNEVTNDLDVAERYAGVDAQQQAVLRQTSATPTPTTRPLVQASSPPASSTKPAGPSIVPSQRSPAALEASSALGSNHTMSKDGWLWQKDAAGNWKRVKPLR